MRRSNYVISPGGAIRGRIEVPGDKSISHRAVMLGALAEGTTRVSGLLEGEDVLATVAAFRAMGVAVESTESGVWEIDGAGRTGLQPPPAAIDLGNSGTCMRLLTGIMAAQDFPSELIGDASLSRRPMRRVTEPLQAMGATLTTAADGTPPIRIEPPGVALRGLDYQMPVASAQIKSALLLAGMYASGNTCVHEPSQSRDHTERMLNTFGYSVRCAAGRVCITGGGTLHGRNIDVPGDISSAAFFLVAACIAPNSDLVIANVGVNPTRTGILDVLTEMGADLAVSNHRLAGSEPVADIRVRSSRLRGVRIAGDVVPRAIDEFPVIFVAAACAEGETVVTGAGELRVKESDRIAVMADGLQTLGISAEPTPDGIRILGGRLMGGEVASHGDHRIAMSFAVAGLAANDSVTISECENVATSFPQFPSLAREAGLKIDAG